MFELLAELRDIRAAVLEAMESSSRRTGTDTLFEVLQRIGRMEQLLALNSCEE